MPITKDIVKKLLPVYKAEQHKYDRGKIMIIGGSTGMTGAPSLSAGAALRSGCGMVTVGIPESLNHIIEIKLTEAMSYPLPDSFGQLAPGAYRSALEFARKCNCAVIGPGAGRGRGTKEMVTHFLRDYSGTLLIDADGLNVLSDSLYNLKKTEPEVILTPHMGEFSRLIGLSSEEILNNREKIAAEFAEKYNVVLVLKGKNTVVTNGNDVYVNTTGNEGMATGGSGDVLAGVIAALSAQGLSAVDAATAGVYIHGLAGDMAKERKSVYSLIASDIIENLPEAFKNITEA